MSAVGASSSTQLGLQDKYFSVVSRQTDRQTDGDLYKS